MDLGKEEKIKRWLATLAKGLLVIFLVFKISEYVVAFFTTEDAEDSNSKVETPAENLEKRPGTETNYQGDSANTPAQPQKKMENGTQVVEERKMEIIPETASIYIFGENGLDAPLTNQLGRTFFRDYAIKAPAGFKKEELLRGELRSAANSELVCVGTVAYSYFTNQFDMITCRIDLSFETYNRITGNKVLELSRSFNEGGPGDSNAMAKAVALRKIQP